MAKKTPSEMIDEAPPAPVKALDPDVLRAATHRLRNLEERLTAQTGNIRNQLRDTRATLEDEQAHLTIRLAQSHPGYELAQLVGYAEHAFLALTAVEEVLDGAQRLREEGQTLLLAVKAQLAALAPTDLIQLEHREQMEKATGPLRYVLTNIGMQLDQVGPLLPVARACVHRTIQATLIVGKAWLVESLTQRLKRIQLMATNLRVPLPEEERLDSLAVRAAKTLDVPLTVPRVVWPSPDNPFQPPSLKD